MNVITYGTFDLFHVGHLRLLKRSKFFGDFLIVALSTERFNKEKGKDTVISYAHRREILLGTKYVDKVIEESSWDQKRFDIQKYNISTFIMGDDWKGKFDYLKNQCEVIYLPRTSNISTTTIKREIAETLKTRIYSNERCYTNSASKRQLHRNAYGDNK